MKGRYIKINLDELNDLEKLVSLKTEWNSIKIVGIGKDNIGVEYNMTIDKAVKAGIMEENIRNNKVV